MPDRSPDVRLALRAEMTAAETLILAERMRAVGAWGAYFALTKAVGAQRERAERVRKQATVDWAAA